MKLLVVRVHSSRARSRRRARALAVCSRCVADFCEVTGRAARSSTEQHVCIHELLKCERRREGHTGKRGGKKKPRGETLSSPAEC
ncbi:hypothetical protein JOB18_046102 [Solea senegalensis]|uniref:Secreted protein n=1 Tax=Solea senegalensis TaxID=28829 RepID=A0AAV6RTB7_SOLSE|nr:hypothetical protein JOB18_046102 [Solea senegalensis]